MHAVTPWDFPGKYYRRWKGLDPKCLSCLLWWEARLVIQRTRVQIPARAWYDPYLLQEILLLSKRALGVRWWKNPWGKWFWKKDCCCYNYYFYAPLVDFFYAPLGHQGRSFQLTWTSSGNSSQKFLSFKLKRKLRAANCLRSKSDISIEPRVGLLSTMKLSRPVRINRHDLLWYG